ncbi:hypothetical protein [Candidatus Rhodobacter oscarellae]|nr:hypothetical protein [Candidatus Rhodobacter lobularis]
MNLRAQETATFTYAQRPFKSLETFNHDGIELVRVRPQKRRELPIRQFFLFALAVLSFKVFLFLNMGGAAYGAKVEEFAQGNTVERAAAWLMPLDPGSEWVVNWLQHGNL